MRVSIYICTTIPAPTLTILLLFDYCIFVSGARSPATLAPGTMDQGDMIPASLRLHLSWHLLVPHIAVYSTNSSPFRFHLSIAIISVPSPGAKSAHDTYVASSRDDQHLYKRTVGVHNNERTDRLARDGGWAESPFTPGWLKLALPSAAGDTYTFHV